MSSSRDVKLSTGRLVALLIVLAGAAALALLFVPADDGPSRLAESPSAGSHASDAPGEVPASDVLTVGSGETLRVDVRLLPADRPAVFALLLPEPPPRGEPLEGRVLAPDGRILELRGEARVRPPAGVDVAIGPGWLTPGRYVLELQTRERAPLPVRRYVLEVRDPASDGVSSPQ